MTQKQNHKTIGPTIKQKQNHETIGPTIKLLDEDVATSIHNTG